MDDAQEEVSAARQKDGADFESATCTPAQEHAVAGEWWGTFERQIEAHWTTQAHGRKPVLVEDGQKIWTSQFTGAGDVAYNLAYLKAVSMGLTRPEVLKAAENARDRARKWSKTIVTASVRGLVTNRLRVIRWRDAGRVLERHSILNKETLLGVMRQVYTRANGERPLIAQVGQLIKAL